MLVARALPPRILDLPNYGRSQCMALVCLTCGYMELYALDPLKLLDRDEQP
jgi:hypothetical protein